MIVKVKDVLMAMLPASPAADTPIMLFIEPCARTERPDLDFRNSAPAMDDLARLLSRVETAQAEIAEYQQASTEKEVQLTPAAIAMLEQRLEHALACLRQRRELLEEEDQYAEDV